MISYDDVSDGLLFNPYSVKINPFRYGMRIIFGNIRILKFVSTNIYYSAIKSLKTDKNSRKEI